MRLFLALILFLSAPLPALAWNAAGHRLIAVIAWQQLSPAARAAVISRLSEHADYLTWRTRARADEAADPGPLILAEAATWADDIRNDPRFYDEGREPPTPTLLGLDDTARHKHWHYVDFDSQGRVQAGELDRQIERLSGWLKNDVQDSLSRKTGKNGENLNALPWLLHLVGDIHQPLHVGRHGDEGGNQVEIENPFNKRLPFSSLHLYWDDLPGPPWLRGQRLVARAEALLDAYPAPIRGQVARWRDESHRLLTQAYPTTQGSLLPIIDETFHARAREIAEQRVVDAGYRLGWLLEDCFSRRVSRETQ